MIERASHDTAPPPSTLRPVQALRSIAAVMVVLYHAHQATLRFDGGHLRNEIDRAFDIGAAGVHLFFLISGFVMVYSTMRDRANVSPAAFYRRRFVRIYPIYWLMALTYVAIHSLLGTMHSVSPWEAVGAGLLIGRGAAAVIGPAWTLGYEVFFYACFGLALLLPRRAGLWVLSAAFVGLVAAGLAIPGLRTALEVQTNPLLLEFLAGCWIGRAWLGGWRLSGGAGGALILAGIAALAAGLPLGFERYPTVLTWGLPSAAILAGALMLRAERPPSPWSWGARLGDSSYFLYLCHILLIDLLLRLPPLRALAQWSPEATPFAIAAVCVTVAQGGHHVIELPLIRQARRLVEAPRRDPARATGG